MERPSQPQNMQIHHSEAQKRFGNKACAKLACGHRQTPRTAHSCPLPALAREASSLAPLEFLTCFSPAQFLKTRLLNVSWSHNHSPLFMDVARSDKISFSELVPNLITPPDQQWTLVCCREKEGESHWRQDLHSHRYLVKMRHPGLCGVRSGLGQESHHLSTHPHLLLRLVKKAAWGFTKNLEDHRE